ncbi:17918_t:CDS:1, partial [Acaulospora morrowiae]
IQSEADILFFKLPHETTTSLYTSRSYIIFERDNFKPALELHRDCRTHTFSDLCRTCMDFLQTGLSEMTG